MSFFLLSRSCSLRDLDSFSSLPHELQKSLIFFDIDETIFMPNTSFIYGFNKTDKFMDYLSTWENQSLVKNISDIMESDYYNSKVFLIENNITRQTIESLMKNNFVVASTARGMNEEDHWLDVIPNLHANGVFFDDFAELNFSNYKEGVFFVGSSKLKANQSYKVSKYFEEVLCKNERKLTKTFANIKLDRICKEKWYLNMVLVDNTRKNDVKFCEFFEQNATMKNYRTGSFVYLKSETLIKDEAMLYQFADIVKRLN